MDLAVPVLTEPVSQQSVAVAAHCFGKWELVPPLSTVLSVTMTQIVAPRPHPVSTALHCAVTTPLTNDMFPLDLLLELLSPRPGHGGIFHCVRPAGEAMPAGGRKHQAPGWSAQPSPKF